MGLFSSTKITYEQPEPRNIYQETMDTMGAAEEVAPRLIELQRQYSPDFIGNQLQQQRASLFGTQGGEYQTAAPSQRYTSGVGFDQAVAAKHPELWEGYQASGFAGRGDSFKQWLREHSENPRADLTQRQLAGDLATKGLRVYEEGYKPGDLVTRTREAQAGLLGGPDAYTTSATGERIEGIAPRLDEYTRQKVRQDFQSQRQGDISDLRELAPQAREAYMAANPEVADRLAQINRMSAQQGQGGNRLMDYATGQQAQSRFGGQPQPAASSQITRPPVRSVLGGQQISGPPTSRVNLANTAQRVGTRQRIPMAAGSSQPAAPQTGAGLPSATGAGTQYAMSRLGQVSPIQGELEAQAQQELALGDKLSEREKRNIRESARSAFGARGLERGNRAIIGEVEARLAENRKRLGERRSFAAGVGGMGENIRRGRFQDVMGAGGQQFGQMATAQQLGLAEQGQDQMFALNALRASQLVDPSQAILGRGLTASNAGAFQQTAGAGVAGSGMNFDPFQNQYAANLYGQNYQGALAGAQGNLLAAQQNAENSGNMFGTLLGGGVGLMTGGAGGTGLLSMIG